MSDPEVLDAFAKRHWATIEGTFMLWGVAVPDNPSTEDIRRLTSRYISSVSARSPE